MTAHPTDIAIVGGGLVGASLAYALASQGWHVTMLEAVAPKAASQPSYDDRTLALSDSSCRILKGLGIWPALEDEATPIRRVIVRELDGPAHVVLNPAEHGLDEFGHVVEARAFGAAMMSILPDLETLRMEVPARVVSVEPGDNQVTLDYELENQRKRIHAALMVGADGAASFVRKAVGIAAREHDYGQTAIVCNITPTRPHEGRAFECFGDTGPMAVLPHRGDRCGLVWCLSAADAEEKLAMTDEAFLGAAQARFGRQLGKFERLGRRSSYPLRQVLAETDTATRTIVLGNAAHAIHPIGAQGFNLGLRDVAALAELLADLRTGRGDPGAPELLCEYHEWRHGDQAATARWSDSLTRLYSSPGLLPGFARTAGLLAHRIFPSLRRRAAARAMGYRGRIPRLALGEPLQDGERLVEQ